MRSLLYIFILFYLQKQTASQNGLRCISCTSAWEACGDKPDFEKLQSHAVPCGGNCMVYKNPNTGLTHRGCSWDLEKTFSHAKQSGTKTIDGVDYTFCDTAWCGDQGDKQETTTISATTKCAFVMPCFNGGKPNKEVCNKCDCPNNFTGVLCETPIIDDLDCTDKVFFCSVIKKEACGDETTRLSCPKLCNPKCQSTI